MSRPFFVLIVLAVVFLGVFHPLILRGCAGLLIVDQPVPPEATTVLLEGGDGQFDRAAELLLHGHCTQVLVQSTPPNRLAYVGILPTWPELCQRELGKRGVSDDRLIVQSIVEERAWDSVRWLDRWLAEHPDERLVVLTDRFRSGNLAYLHRRVLAPEHRDRLTIRALPDRRYDETNWWRRRAGIKAVLGILISGFSNRCLGERQLPSFDPDPDVYEQRLGLP